MPLSLMRSFEERFGVQIRQLWDDGDISGRNLAWPPPGVSEQRHWELRNTQGRPCAESRPESSTTKAQRCRMTASPWENSRYADHGSRGPTTETPMTRSSNPAGFFTGDVGRIDPQGYITLTDRAKDVIKSGGEMDLLRGTREPSHRPSVGAEAAVVAVPDERWQERPLAAVVLEAPAPSTPGVAAPSWRTRSRSGGCPSGGHSSRRFRGPASASTTRRPSGPPRRRRLRGGLGSPRTFSREQT